MISGRKPIFSVAKSLDFTIKVENHYSLVSGLASCRVPWQPETDCRIERPFPSAVRHCGHTQKTFLEDRQRRRFMRFRGGRCLRNHSLLSRSFQADSRLSTGSGGPFVRWSFRNRAQLRATRRSRSIEKIAIPSKSLRVKRMRAVPAFVPENHTFELRHRSATVSLSLQVI